MFDVDLVPVTLRKLSLKIADVDDDNGDPNRVRLADLTFRIPVLGHDLASKIRLPIVGHCFGRDKLPLWGVHEVRFEPLDEQYTATLASAPDIPATITLELVDVVRVRVWRPNTDKRELALEFVTRHELARGDARDLAALMSVWESSETRLTLATVQLPLELGDEDEPVKGTPRRSASAHGRAH